MTVLSYSHYRIVFNNDMFELQFRTVFDSNACQPTAWAIQGCYTHYIDALRVLRGRTSDPLVMVESVPLLLERRL